MTPLQLPSFIQKIINLRFGDQQLWSRARKVMTLLMVFQLVLFSWIYIPELSGRWADISPLLSTVLVASLVLVVLVMAYYRWFDRVPILHKIIGYASRVFIVFYLLQWFFLVLYWIILPPLTCTQLGSIMGGYGLRRDYVAYDQISAHMKLAVLASEDQLFTDHDGFDVKSIKLALKYNKRKPGKTRGASTISQQTAKNVFLWQGRNFIRKGLEVYFTFMIETFWSKRTILSRYLNVIEMGPGIFGVQAAAKVNFNKAAKDLTRAEAAMIAACLPSPKRYTLKPMSRYVQSRYDDIMVQMNNLESDPDVAKLIGSNK